MTKTHGDHLYYFLDGMRGLAALFVVQRHAASFLGGIPFESSYLAVDFFFVLSGFVITHAYDSRLRNGMSMLEFGRRRLIRLYPMYLLALIMVAVYYKIAGPDFSYVTLFGSFLFLPNLVIPQAFLLAPAWSLFCEWIANILYAGATKTHATGPTIYLTAMLVGMVGVFLCVAYYGTVDVGFRNTDVWGGVARALFGFFAGVIVYRYRQKVPPVPLALSLSSAALLMVSMTVSVTPAVRPAYDLLVLAVAPAVVLAASTVTLSPKLRHVCKILGDLSYPVYVLHLPGVLITSYVMLNYFHKPQGSLMSVLIWSYVVVSAGLSWVLGEFVDKSVRGWLIRTHSPQYSCST